MILILCALVCINPNGYSQQPSEPIVPSFDKNRQMISLGDTIAYCIEQDGPRSLDEIRRQPFLQANTSPIAPSSLLSDTAIWLRFALVSGYKRNTFAVLDFGKKYDCAVDVYVVHDDLIDHYTSSRYIDINNWNHRTIEKKTLEAITIYPKGSHEVFIRIADGSEASLDIVLMALNAFYPIANNDYIADILLIGFFLAIFTYNLFLWTSNPDRSSLFYVLTLFAFIVYLLSDFSNFLNIVLPTELAFFTERSSAVFGTLGFLFLLLYSDAILELKQRWPAFHRFFTVFAVVIGVIASLLVIDPRINGFILSARFSYIGSMLCIFIAAIYVVRNGFNTGYYFIAAWSFFFASVTISQIYWAFDIHPVPFIVKNIGDFSTVVPVVALSLPLGARIRRLKMEKLEIEMEKKKVEELDNAKSRFFADIAHEIKTPLNLILAPCEDFLQGIYGKTVPADHTIFKIIYRNAQHLHRSFNNILAFSRLEAAFSHINPKAIHPNEQIKRIMAQFEHSAQKKDITLLLKNRLDTDVTVWFDPVLFSLLFVNLLSNAITYNKEQGEVFVILEQHDQSLTIAVRDTGSGIPQEHQATIFQPFVQLQENRADPHGAGMGLALVKKIVDLHGVSLELTSSPEAGSEFILTIPIHSISDQATEQAATHQVFTAPGSPTEDGGSDTEQSPPLTEAQTNKKSILIMEDNTDLSTYLQTHFSPIYNVRLGKNGKEALDILNQGFIPDIIISDIMAPVMDGRTFHDEVNKIEHLTQVPFLFLTVIDDEEELIDRLSSGAVDYITKPFDPKTLEAKIESLLRLAENQARASVFNRQKAVERYKEELFSTYGISSREREVIELLLIGKTQKEIATILYIAPHTVKRHTENIYRKLHLSSRHELYDLMQGEGMDDERPNHT